MKQFAQYTATVFAALLLLPAGAFAATTGALSITVTNELGSALSGAGVAIKCQGDTAFRSITNGGTNVTDAGGIIVGTTTNTSVCATGQSPDIQVTENGYITKIIASSSPAYNAAATEAVNVYSVAGTQFALKMVVKDELGNAKTPTTITYNGNAATTNVSNTYYFAQTGTSQAVVINLDGYVNNATTNTGLSNVSLNAATQTVINLGANAANAAAIAAGATASEKGLTYALKVTAAKASDASPASGGGITAGDSLGIQCAESATTGIYYCAIPLAHTGTVAQFIGNGYLTATTSYTDRTAATDAQGTASLSLQGGFGSGGNGGSYDPYIAIILGGGNTKTPASTTASSSISSNVTVQTPTPPTPPKPSSPPSPPAPLGITFTGEFGLGAKGADVSALQTYLEGKSFLIMPSGVTKGYFGAVTKKALQAYQKVHGIAQTGYVGPKTRAAIAAGL